MGCSLKVGVISIAIIFIVISVMNLSKLSSNLVKYHRGRHHRYEPHNGYDGEHHNGHHGEHHNRHHGDELHHGHDGEHHNGQHREHHNEHHGGLHRGHHGGHHDRHQGEHHVQHKHGKHGGHHKHHHHEDRNMTTTNSSHVPPVLYGDNKMLFGRDEKKLALVREHMMETTAYPKMSDDDFDRQKKFCHKKSTLILGIVASLITILFSCLMFAAVSEDVGINQRRRNFLLPFIVWHLLGVVLFIAGGTYSFIKHRDHLPPIGFLILIIFVCLMIVGVLSTFIHIVVRYFKSLSVSSGFDYGQMVDDDIKKQPLA